MTQPGAALAPGDIKEEKKKRKTGQGQPDCYQEGRANLHGGLIINETPDIWLLPCALPMTSVFMSPGCSQDTHPEAADRTGLVLWEHRPGPDRVEGIHKPALAAAGAFCHLELLGG